MDFNTRLTRAARWLLPLPFRKLKPKEIREAVMILERNDMRKEVRSSMESTEAPIIELVNVHREAIERGAKEVLALKKHSFFKQGESPEEHDRGEMIANIMLAYRHLEDARMRLGKVLQAHNGGESIYDKPVGENVASDESSAGNPVDLSRNEGEQSA